MKILYKNTKLRFINLLFISLGITGCNFIEIPVPTDRLVSNTLFENEVTANTAILSLYSKLVFVGIPFSNGGTTILTGLASDELNVTQPTNDYLQFQTNQLTSNNGVVTVNFWQRAYEVIYQANACIEGIENSNEIPSDIKRQLMGEAYFIRAFCYWYLINLFGDVPLITSTDYESNRLLARTDATLVKEFLMNDLLKAHGLLTPEYPSDGKLRVNYYTVLALLSRYYLYEEKWEEAEALATEIIQSPLYSYDPNINNIFKIESDESIWQLQSSQPQFNTVEGAALLPSTVPRFLPPYTVTEHLLADFESGDLRRTSWIASRTVSGVTYLYPFKYKVWQNPVKTENYVMFRLGETYLNRAEARAELGNVDGALQDMNIIRNRANLPDLTVENTPDILQAIYQERRIELFCEWGHRWFDLKRTGRINEILGAVKPHWQPSAALFPIPLREILANPNLIPNPGYNN